MAFIYRLSSSQALSIEQLRQALREVVINNESLRTSLNFDDDKKLLIQRVVDWNALNHELFTFIQSDFQTDKQLDEIIQNEKRNSQCFDLARGRVFRCHVVQHTSVSTNDLLGKKDILILNFHSAAFDLHSKNLFFADLNHAYNHGRLRKENNTCVRYLDCKYM